MTYEKEFEQNKCYLIKPYYDYHKLSYSKSYYIVTKYIGFNKLCNLYEMKILNNNRFRSNNNEVVNWEKPKYIRKLSKIDLLTYL